MFHLRMASSAAMELNRYMSFTVLGIVANGVSLVSIVLVEQCVNCRTKEAVSHYGKSILQF